MAVVSTGTVAFAVAAVVCWFTRADLAAIGKLWYLGVSLTGTALGLLGLAFGIYRKLRRRRQLTVPADASIEEALVDTDGVPDRE
jgi:multisubunit Na+/H+ antiporter MnhB subunit